MIWLDDRNNRFGAGGVPWAKQISLVSRYNRAYFHDHICTCDSHKLYNRHDESPFYNSPERHPELQVNEWAGTDLKFKIRGFRSKDKKQIFKNVKVNFPR